ncbi:MAG: hypothetical protein ACLQDM_05930, partial [Bradyrhizobium sp.]
LLAFRESPPFLEREVDRQNYDGVFLDGWLFVHNLSDDELNTLAGLVSKCGADRLPLFWDPGPLIAPSPSQLISPRPISAVIGGAKWTRIYVSGRTEVEYPYNPRFDFSAAAVRDALKTHLEILDREYGGVLKPSLDNAELAAKRFQLMRGRFAIVLKALAGDKESCARIWRKIHSLF